MTQVHAKAREYPCPRIDGKKAIGGRGRYQERPRLGGYLAGTRPATSIYGLGFVSVVRSQPCVTSKPTSM